MLGWEVPTEHLGAIGRYVSDSIGSKSSVLVVNRSPHVLLGVLHVVGAAFSTRKKL